MPMLAISEITARRLEKVDENLTLDKRSISGKYYIYITHDVMKWLTFKATKESMTLEQAVNRLITDYIRVTKEANHES